MRTLLFALLALALSGCSTTWPESASLNPIINDQPDTILPQGTRIKVDSSDARVGSQIIKIKIKKRSCSRQSRPSVCQIHAV